MVYLQNKAQEESESSKTGEGQAWQTWNKHNLSTTEDWGSCYLVPDWKILSHTDRTPSSPCLGIILLENQLIHRLKSI